MIALNTRSNRRHVKFRLRDVHLPDPAVLLQQLHADEVLEGDVIDSSDSGINGGVFLVIQIDGLPQPIILAADRVLESPVSSPDRTDE